MKKLIVLIWILFGIGILHADTHISAGNVSGIWTYANSPYIIDGEISIQIGDELVIEPGVQVTFSGHYKFIVYGRLIAEGTSSEIILFTALDHVTGWYGLRFVDSNTNGQDGSSMIYCTFEYGNATGSFPEGAGGAIRCNNSSDVLIKNSVITNNTAALDGGGVWCGNYSSPTLINVIISNNVATGLDGGGMFCWNYCNPSLTDVLICGNFAGSTGGGICCWDWSSLVLTNVTITGNTATSSGGGIYNGYSDYNLVNCILWDNTPDEINYWNIDRSITVTYSDVKNGTGQSWLGTGCIDADPLFVNPANEDYHLSWTNFPVADSTKSPCIDSGDPSSPLDPDSTRADMGAYYFDQTSTLTPPQNVTINIISTDVQLTWDAVAGATSYKVYSSDNPYSDFTEDISGTFDDVSWMTAISESKKFYYVTAIQ